MRVPRAIQSLIENLERLPGIGPKTAQRLTYYLLHVPQGELDRFASALQNLKKGTVICSTCFGIVETSPCELCQDMMRDKATICVVEQPLDIMAIERSGGFKGVYHVLHGRIDPLNNIGPDEIKIGELLKRVKAGRINGSIETREIILATNPTMEGEATAMYIAKQTKSLNIPIKVTRIGRGLPTGADMEYADPMTLTRAMEGRTEY